MINSVFISQGQCPGDILMLTCAVRDLKLSYPSIRINVDTPAAPWLWAHNPNLDRTLSPYAAEVVLNASYPQINRSNTQPYHFCHGFRKFINDRLGLDVKQGPSRCDIYLSENEKEEVDWIRQLLGGITEGYWIIDAGYKNDFTAKHWETERYQAVVDATKHFITWVQIGEKHHNHAPLNNVFDLRGHTGGRRIVQLMYRAAGVLTPVSFPMHLSTMPMWCSSTRQRPCVVIAGGRESAAWEMHQHHQFLHTLGALPCCDNGACWTSRTLPLGDKDEKDRNPCIDVVKSYLTGRPIQACMDLITPQMVVEMIALNSRYYESLERINGRRQTPAWASLPCRHAQKYDPKEAAASAEAKASAEAPDASSALSSAEGRPSSAS